MINHVYAGKKVKHVVAGSAMESGDVVVLECGIGIASCDGEIGDTVEVMIEEAFRLPKVDGTAFVAGDRLFWDSSNEELTKTELGNKPAGVASEAAASGDTEAVVKLQPTIFAQAANEAAVATADGSDAATTQALANALKAAHNSLLTKLKAAGLMLNA